MRNIVNSIIVVLSLCCCMSCSDDDSLSNFDNTDENLNRVRDAFDIRREAAFETLRGKDLVRGAIQPPISGSGVLYYRALC